MRGGFAWIEKMFEQGVMFVAADAPHINTAYYAKMKAIDNDRRDEASERIKLALDKARSSGISLGGKRDNSEGLSRGPEASAKSRQIRAQLRDRTTWWEIKLIRRRGVTSLTDIADRLNKMGARAPRGGLFTPTQVRRVIDKFDG